MFCKKYCTAARIGDYLTQYCWDHSDSRSCGKSAAVAPWCSNILRASTSNFNILSVSLLSFYFHTGPPDLICILFHFPQFYSCPFFNVWAIKLHSVDEFIEAHLSHWIIREHISPAIFFVRRNLSITNSRCI